jgi:hypothetical protein
MLKPPPTHAVQVNLKLFQPAPGKRKTCILFVIRDRTRTPFPKLCSDSADLDVIWDTVTCRTASCSVTDFST